jgi:hypothetical protein
MRWSISVVTICRVVLLGLLGTGMPFGSTVGAEQRGTGKAALNPVSNLISAPFQNNTNFNAGPDEKPRNILNIHSVIPVSLNSQ